MIFQLISVQHPLFVEGTSETEAVGGFRGRVLALGVAGADPVADAAIGSGPDQDTDEEGFLGWGSTYMLVCDENYPAPVWVAKADVDRHWFEGEKSGARAPSSSGAGS
jgi:hypothetical protein